MSGIEEKNTKNNSENDSVRNKIHEALSKLCFGYTVTFVWKGVPSSEITQIRICLQSEYVEKYQFELCSKYDREYDFDVILG